MSAKPSGFILRRPLMRVVAMLAFLSHSWTLTIAGGGAGAARSSRRPRAKAPCCGGVASCGATARRESV